MMEARARSRHGVAVHEDGTSTFNLWAPRVESVELLIEGRPEQMVGEPGGWRTATVRAAHGDDYAYRLDGGPERADPASRWQPEGVHGASRVFDPAAYAWSRGETAWRAPPLAGAVIYELHVGTFTADGTFDAAAERLGHLVDLGVTHVEVMPVNAFNGTYGWGYDGVAWYAVHEPYGGPLSFARFVDACHRAGLAVVLDVVYNHLGPSGNHLPEFGPYQTERYTTPWGPAMNLDGPGSDAVRGLIVGNALQWLRDFRVDALRLDAVHGLIDTSAVHILAELSEAVASLAAHQARPLQVIAESDRNDPLTITSLDRGGAGMDAQWADDLHHAIHVAVTGERDGYYVDYTGLRDVAAAYERGFVYDGRFSVYRDRTVGSPLTRHEGWRFVACIQNHDQVGNRAFGERLTELAPSDLVRVAIVLLCAAPHVPMLFMGDEYGETRPFQYFTDHPEPELAAAVRQGRREEFAAFAAHSTVEVPDPQGHGTFERSRLAWSAADTDAGRARQRLWRDALRLRRQQAALRNGRRDLVETVHAETEVLTVRRRDPSAASVLLTVNLGDRPQELPVSDRWSPLLDTADTVYGGDGRTAEWVEGAVAQPGRSATLWGPLAPE